MLKENELKFVFRRLILTSIFFLIMIIGGCCSEQSCPNNIVKAIVVTGGHDYEKESFLQMFDSLENIKYVPYELKDESEIFEDLSSWEYDVLILYNMTQGISESRKRNFEKLLNEKGIGLVVLHHSIANYQDWPEYRKIIGAKYYLEDKVENGVSYKRGEWKEGVDLNIHVKNKSHPVTKGLSDFKISDETYKNYILEPGLEMLLTTDNPLNEKSICWVKKYGRSRVCYIQLGHGRSAYENKNYRRLLLQAINWCSAK